MSSPFPHSLSIFSQPGCHNLCNPGPMQTAHHVHDGSDHDDDADIDNDNDNDEKLG